MKSGFSNKWLANLLQGGLLALLLVLASYVTIGRILIANVDTYRNQITNLLATNLGVPVHIQELKGDWAYLDPTLKIEKLDLGDLNSIKLNEVSVTIDVIGSLRERTLIFREAMVDGLRLTLERDGDRWQVMGLPPSDRPLDLKPLLSSIDYLVGLKFSDIEIEVLGQETSFVLRTDPARPGEVRRVGEMLSLAVPMQIQDEHGLHDFLFAGHYQGGIGAKDSSGDLYLNLPHLVVTEFLPAAQLELLQIASVNIGGEIWASFLGEQVDLRGKTNLALTFSAAEHDLWSDQTFAVNGRVGGEMIGTVAEIKGDFAGVEWRFADIGLSFEPGPDGAQLALQIPTLNLTELLQTPLELGKLGIGLNQNQVVTLEALNPAGNLNSIYAIVQLGEQLDYRVVSALEGVRVDRYMALPMISDLNGLVQFGPHGGFLDMVNERPFSLQFPNLFEQQWHFDDARTRVTYDVSEQGIQAQSGLVRASLGDLVANGRVHLRLPGDPLQTTWGLELGVQNAELLDAFRYLPKTVKEDVRAWLERGILGGRSHESGMLFHGSLAKQAPKDQKVHQLYFEVTDAILDYDPNWPRFDDLAATIFIDNFEISSGDAVGQVFDSEVFGSTVMVPVSAEGVADAILINGKLKGQFSDGVRILNETPLAEATSNMAEGWVANGAMAGTAQLNIPIGPRAEQGVPVWADLKLSVADASVNMTKYDLDFHSLDGEFHYESNSAMNADEFSAELFGQPVIGKITSYGDAEGGEIVVHLDGTIDAKDLYTWSDQPLLSTANGLMTYTSQLHVHYGARGEEPLYVVATSDLVGVSLALPEPMFKTENSVVPLRYQQTFFDVGYNVEIDLGDAVQTRLNVVDGSISGGRIHFGDELDSVSYEKLKVTGSLDKVVYEEWDNLSRELESLSEGSLEEELEKTLDDVDIQIAMFDVFGFEMDVVRTRITRDPGFWHVDLTNSWLDGRVSVSDDDLAPLDIAMKRLAFDTVDEEAGADPFSDVSPSDLALARFSVESLILDGEDYGRWAFLYEPRENQATLSELDIQVRGLQVAQDARVYWQYDDGAHSSQFDGQVLVPDLGVALQQWGYAQSIEGQDFSLYADISWPGSPAMVDIDVIDGLIRVMQGEGRFVQADSNMGALRLLGIFDFASLARRFRFDFSDVVESGFSFSSIEGETRFTSGVVDVVDPILIEGSGSIFKVAGRVDLTSRQLDNDMIVTLPVNRNLPWYAAYSAFATGPLTGAGVFLAQRVFQNQINAISSAKYKITGTMDEPVIEFVSIFSDSVREAPEAPDAAPGK